MIFYMCNYKTNWWGAAAESHSYKAEVEVLQNSSSANHHLIFNMFKMRKAFVYTSVMSWSNSLEGKERFAD